MAVQVQLEDGLEQSIIFIDGHIVVITESITISVVWPEAYRDNMVWMVTFMAGVLNISNIICAILSLLALEFRGACY